MLAVILCTLIAINCVLVLMAVTNVLISQMEPYKAMFWVMTIIFIPFIGMVLFLFFGKSLHKKRIIADRQSAILSERTIAEFNAQDNLVIPSRHLRVVHLFASLTLALPFKNNHVEIFTDGASFFLSLLQAIGKAKHHIHIITYIYDDDAMGNLLADALIDRAREGIEVRLIYDDVGSWRTSHRLFERMREAGIDVEEFMPVRFPAFTGRVNYRNHRKICVIDGREGFIGGMNIATRYAKGSRGSNWCDTHLRIEGGVVSSLQRSFLDDWYLVDHTLVLGDEYYPAPKVKANNCLAQVVLGSPRMAWHGLMQGYISIIYEARKYVYIETPYFIPTQSVLIALQSQALAGIDVRVMLPEHADWWFVEHAARSYIDAAFDAGVKFYLYTPGINHTKMLVCDDCICTCGSTNIDFRSFENNSEANVFFFDTEMALRMKHIFMDDLKHCTALEDNYLFNHPRFFSRVCDGFVRLFSPLM